MKEESHFSITVQTEDLNHILGFSSSVVEKRNTLPILGHIKLEAKDNKLYLTATDMDLSIRQEIGAEVKHEGSITVHSQTFSDIVRKIGDKTIEMKYLPSGSQLEILAQHYNVTLSTLPAEEFPAMDYFVPKFEFATPAKTILELLECTKFAISTEETRYNLNGVYFHSTPDAEKFFLAAAATDGHRLSTCTSSVIVRGEFGIILPRKTVNELYKILKDSDMIDKEVKITVGHNRIMFTCGNLIVISKLIEGAFPDYRVFLPVSNSNILTIPSKLLTTVVDRVATVTADKFPAIKVTIMEDQLELDAHGEAKGLAHEVIPIDNESVKYKGNQITIGFNPKYVLDVLSALGDDELTIMLADGFSPALIKSKNYPGANFVVMPVKV
jgi:DNA polymerase-3 subunit beta